jgi:hypothetical protein
MVLFDGAGRAGASVAAAVAAAAGTAGSSAIARAKAAALGTRRAVARRGRGLESLAVTCTFQKWVAQARFGAPKHSDTGISARC